MSMHKFYREKSNFIGPSASSYACWKRKNEDRGMRSSFLIAIFSYVSEIIEQVPLVLPERELPEPELLALEPEFRPVSVQRPCG